MTSEDPEDTRKRKRERDKQNQREKRRREKDTFQELELRNACLERQLKELYDGTNGDVKDLTDTVRSLRAENAALRERLRRVDQFVKCWATEDDQTGEAREPPSVHENKNGEVNGFPKTSAAPTATSNGSVLKATPIASAPSSAVEGLESRQAGGSLSGNLSTATGFLNTNVSGSSAVESYRIQELEARDYVRSLPVTHAVSEMGNGKVLGDADDSNPLALHEKRPDMTIEDIAVKLGELVKIPAWERLPPNIEVHRCFDPFGSTIRQLKSKPEQFGIFDLEPTALDLLFGGSLNELANAVFEATAQIPSRRTEKLAINYLDYLMARWIINPTEKNWDRIPNMLLPTAVQLFVPHPPMFDYVVWPQMRDNFIRTGMKYCRSEVLGLLFCTCRIRDTPNSDFVTRTGGGEPQVDPRFIEKISTIEGWVLLDKFWTEYPELVNGMDAEKFMISEKDLN